MTKTIRQKIGSQKNPHLRRKPKCGVAVASGSRGKGHCARPKGHTGHHSRDG